MDESGWSKEDRSDNNASMAEPGWSKEGGQKKETNVQDDMILDDIRKSKCGNELEPEDKLVADVV